MYNKSNCITNVGNSLTENARVAGAADFGK